MLARKSLSRNRNRRCCRGWTFCGGGEGEADDEDEDEGLRLQLLDLFFGRVRRELKGLMGTGMI